MNNLLCYLRLHKKEPKLESFVSDDMLVTRAFHYCERCNTYFSPCHIEYWDFNTRKKVDNSIAYQKRILKFMNNIHELFSEKFEDYE